MFFYRLLTYISSFTFPICLLVAAYYIWKGIRSLLGKERITFTKWIDAIKHEMYSLIGNFATVILVISLLSVLITNTAVHQFVGVYNLKVLPSGTYCFYVEAHRLGGNNYTLPAQIRIEKETEEVDDDREKTYTYYYIEKLFFSNGEVLDIKTWDSVEINDPEFHTDSTGGEWEFTLINKHAYSPNAAETNNADWLDITFLLIKAMPILFLLIVMLRKESTKGEDIRTGV